jgi:hypothetical protein
MSLEDFLTAYGGLVGVLVGVAGTAIVSYVTYRIAKPVKGISYSIWTENLVRQLSSWVSDLELSYKGTSIHAATISKIVIWNSGNRELKREDVAPAARLRISAKEPAEVLSGSVVEISSPANNSKLLPPDGGGFRYIDFDYLNRADGLAVQLVHTGVFSRELLIEGQVIGGAPASERSPWRNWVVATPISLPVIVALILGALQAPLVYWQTFLVSAIIVALVLFVVFLNGRPKRVLLRPHFKLLPYVVPFDKEGAEEVREQEEKQSRAEG